MQREAGGRTRDAVRSGRSAPQFGWGGRTDADAHARGHLAADQEGLAPMRSVVGRDCNAAATTTKFVADGPRSTG